MMSGPLKMSDLPLVTVVTPSLNMSRYLRETIESVLAQDYPRIEYIVADGGSTDGTLELLSGYAGRLQFYSQPDHGAADAINQAFRRSKGDIFAYLNADDTYLPGAVSAAVRALQEYPEAAGVYGDGYWVDEGGRTLGPYPTQCFDAVELRHECFICQPTAFLRRTAFQEAGLMNVALHFTFDYDLWIRIAKRHTMQKIDRFLATSRMHRENKTIGQRRAVLRESMALLSTHFGYVPYKWASAYACHLVDGRDQFFEPTALSSKSYALTLLIGLRHNLRHPIRFLREWVQLISLRGLVRRFQAFFTSFSG